MTTLIIGACTLIQGAIPDILEKTPTSFFDNVCEILELHAKYCFERVSKIKGLSSVESKGAMYYMVKIDISYFDDDIEDDITFSRLLFKEQSVFVLPGQSFNIHNYMRIVICAPQKILCQAFNRIEEFCLLHAKKE
jgi:tyrosine aminotransferase